MALTINEITYMDVPTSKGTFRVLLYKIAETKANAIGQTLWSVRNFYNLLTEYSTSGAYYNNSVVTPLANNEEVQLGNVDLYLTRDSNTKFGLKSNSANYTDYRFIDANHPQYTWALVRTTDNQTLMSAPTGFDFYKDHTSITYTGGGYPLVSPVDHTGGGEQGFHVSDATVNTDELIEILNALYDGSSAPDTDPYTGGGGASGGGGGEGDFDDTSDTIPIPSLPSISGLNTGFFTAFVCTQSQLQSVSNYLWTNVIDDIIDTSTGLGEKVDALKKMVTSPYDAIMGCSLVPVIPPTGGSKDLKMYGVIDTGITLPYASSRWVAVDCGTLNIHEFWGSYLDYSPYTKTTSLYLPYIGVVSVDIDLIMAKSLQVVYHVDILTGICIAYIVVDGSVKFQYQGHCSTTIPVTSSDYSGAIQSGLGLVGNIANVVSAGASGGLSGGLGGATLGAVSSAISQAPSVASNVMGMKPDIKSGGGVGSSGGILGVQKPFLIIERPKQSVPAFQNGFSGYPCNMTKTLKDLSGYTEVERINLTNISLTEDEKNELLEILQSGVYL